MKRKYKKTAAFCKGRSAGGPKRRFGRLAGGAAILLMALVLAGMLRMTGGALADSDIWITFDTNHTDPNKADAEYTMDNKTVTAYFGTSGDMYADEANYKITWSTIGSPGIVNMTENDKTHCVLEALSTGSVELQVTVEAKQPDGTWARFKYATCTIKVTFAISTYGSDFGFVNQETTKSLVLTSGGTAKKVELVFDAPGATWRTLNRDVVSLSAAGAGAGDSNNSVDSTAADGSIYVIPKGGGRTTLRATYEDSSGREHTASIIVYVRPRISTPDTGFENGLTGKKLETGTQLVTEVGFEDNLTELLSQKVQWVILYQKGSDYKFLKDSLGNTGETPDNPSDPNNDDRIHADDINVANLSIYNSQNGSYKLEGKAGKYQILFFPYGAYTQKYSEAAGIYDTCRPVTLETTILADVKDGTESMVIGDTIDLADYFNVTDNFLKKYTTCDVASGDSIEFSSGDNMIQAKNTGESVLKITFNSTAALDEFLPSGSSGKSSYLININVIGEFKLNITEATTYIGKVLDLKTSYNPGGPGTYKWEADQEGCVSIDAGTSTAKVTALKETRNNPVTVKVTCTLPSGVKRVATCRLTIKYAIDKLEILPQDDIYINEREIKYLSTTNGTNPIQGAVDFKWFSSDEEIVKVTPIDGNFAATITGVKSGVAIITVLNSQNDVTATRKVTVIGELTDVKFKQGNQMTVRLAQGVVQLIPVTTPDKLEGVEYDWSSDKTNVATVDETGLVKLVGPGTTTVMATPRSNPRLHAYCVITVEQSSEGFKLKTTSLTLDSGKTKKLEYTLTPADAKTTVTWKSLEPSVATVNGEGVVTAVNGGQAYIVATTTEGFTDICKVTVTQSASGITLSSYDVNVAVGETYQVEAKASPAGSTEKTFTWTSRDPDIAPVDNTGKITGVSAGKTTITVKTKTGKVEFVYVTVREDLTGMSLNFTDRTIAKGKSFTLKPVFTPADPTNKKVTWRSTSPGKATVSANGVVKGVNGGMAVIIATSEDGGFTAFCVVTVEEAATSIKLNKASAKLGIGRKLTLKATVESNFATNKNLKWTSSNTRVATVNQKGQVTGKKLGKAVIRVRATDGSGATDSCTVTVVRQVTSIRLNKTTIRMLEGRTTTIRAVVKPSNATTKSVTWSSDDENVATIDSRGTIMGVAVGRCKITAAAKDGTNKKASCWVYVTAAVPATGITVSQKDMVLIRGTSEQLSVTIQPSGSTDSLSYASDNKNVASVSSRGRVTARKPGVAGIVITTSSGSQTTVTVTVVGLNKTNLVKRQYETETLWVEEVTTSVAWQSQDTSVATVDQTGRVVCRKPGTTYIVATVKGIKLYCKITVTRL